MTLEEVLNLNKEKASIKKIDTFLSSTDLLSDDYNKALSYKALILYKCNETEEALKLLLTSIVNLDSLSNDSIVAICDSLIFIFMDIKSYDQCLKYIDLKNHYLSLMDKSDHYLDLINYYVSLNNHLEIKRNILLFLNESTNEDKRLYVLEILVKYYYVDREYDKYYKVIDELESLYMKRALYDKITLINISKASIMIERNELDDAIDLIQKILDIDSIGIDPMMKSVTYLIDIYLRKNDLRHAMILESEYQEFLDNTSTKEALAFSLKAKELYEHLNNQLAIDDYNNKITKYQTTIKNTTKEHKKKPPKVNIDIIITDKPKPVEKEEIKQDERIIDLPTIDITSNFIRMEQVLNNFKGESCPRFRDLMRNYGITLEEMYSSCEMVLVINESLKGYHYKVSRLYDKNFTMDMYQDTILKDLCFDLETIFIPNIKDSKYDKNIVTGEPYNESFRTLIGFRLYRNDVMLGSIIYVFFTDTFKDHLIFESLKLFTRMLSMALNHYITEDNKSTEETKSKFIIDNSKNGLKEDNCDIITLNETALNILGIKENKISLYDYASMIDAKEASGYKANFSNIYNHKPALLELKYHFNDKYIKETITIDTKNGLNIYSMLEDITDIEIREKELLDMAYHNPISKIPSKVKLYDDLVDGINNKKFSLSLIDIENFKKYYDIYGYSFCDEIFYAIGEKLEEICSKYPNIYPYHVESDKFALYFKNINDIRVVLKETKEILDKLSDKLYGINERLKLHFKAGVYRYIKNSYERQVSKIIEYASIALMNSKEFNGNSVVAYDNLYAKKIFNESQIVLHISEAIDKGLLNIRFHQIVDLSINMVGTYMAKLNLSNFIIDEKYFTEVVGKRDLRELVDKYLIDHTISEIKLFYEKTGCYINTMLPIHKSTLLSYNFIEFLMSKLIFFNVPNKYISIYIIDDKENDLGEEIEYLRNNEIKVASQDFDFSIRNKTSIYFCDINKYSNELILMLIDDCKKLNIDLYAREISDMDSITKCKNLGINNVYGSYFKKSFLIKELINNANVIN